MAGGRFGRRTQKTSKKESKTWKDRGAIKTRKNTAEKNAAGVDKHYDGGGHICNSVISEALYYLVKHSVGGWCWKNLVSWKKQVRKIGLRPGGSGGDI